MFFKNVNSPLLNLNYEKDNFANFFNFFDYTRNLFNNKKQKIKNLSDLKEAMYYRKLEGNLVQCQLCPNKCLLREGQRGICKVREKYWRKTLFNELRKKSLL